LTLRAPGVLRESNHFVRPELDLRPIPDEGAYFGAIPPTLFAWVKRRFVALARGEAQASRLSNSFRIGRHLLGQRRGPASG